MVFPGKALLGAVAAGAVMVYAGYPKWTATLVGFLGFLGFGGLDYLKLACRTLPRDLSYIAKFAKIIKEMVRVKKMKLYLSDGFQETVARHPNKVAIMFEDRTMTFKELDDLSNKIANMLRATTSLQRGDSMAIFMENCPEYVAIYLALSKIGVTGAFINCNLRGKPLAHCIRTGHCTGAFHASDMGGALADILSDVNPAIGGMLFSVGGESTIPGGKTLEKEIEGASSNPPAPLTEKSAEDLACYIYTSGTTGLPKACNIKHTRFYGAQFAMGIFMGIKPDDIVYVSMPLYHMTGGVLGVGQMLCYGATVVIRRKFSVSNFWDDCIKYKCTVFIYIGEMCRYLLSQDPKPEDTQHSIRVMMGNGLRSAVWRDFQNRFHVPRVVEYYASTEGNCSFINGTNKVGAVGSLSRIIPFMNPASLVKINQETGEYIRDSQGFCMVAGIDEPGEVVGKIMEKIPSSHFSGYTDASASKRKVITDVFKKGDKYFRSGDILRMDADGYLYFCDRIGDTFRWKGENVATTEVENTMGSILKMKDVVVYGVEVPGSEGRAGMAAIEASAGTLDLQDLASQLFHSLPSYAVPLFIRLLPVVEVTGTFKLKKVKLRNEGFDVTLPDPLYFLDSSSKSYVPLTEELYQQIRDGKKRL